MVPLGICFMLMPLVETNYKESKDAKVKDILKLIKDEKITKLLRTLIGSFVDYDL